MNSLSLFAVADGEISKYRIWYLVGWIAVVGGMPWAILNDALRASRKNFSENDLVSPLVQEMGRSWNYYSPTNGVKFLRLIDNASPVDESRSVQFTSAVSIKSVIQL